MPHIPYIVWIIAAYSVYRLYVYLLLRVLAQERLVLGLSAEVPAVLSACTHVGEREAVEDCRRHSECEEDNRERILRCPAEASVHRIVLLAVIHTIACHRSTEGSIFTEPG